MTFPKHSSRSVHGCGARLVLALGLTIFPAHAAIVNGSFETPVISNATFLNVVGGAEPSGFGWSVVTNNVDIFSVGVLGLSGAVVDGNQGLDLVGFGSTGAIQQSFSTIPGQTYTLTFYYGNNPGSGASSALVTVSDGGNTLLSETVSHSTSSGTDFDWTLFSNTFTASGTSALLRFDNTLGGNNGGILLDLVAVDPFTSTAVPEPSAGWLAGAGLAALTALRKIRSQRLCR